MLSLTSCALFDRAKNVVTKDQTPSSTDMVATAPPAIVPGMEATAAIAAQGNGILLPEDPHLGDLDFHARAMLADPERNPNVRPTALPGNFPKESWSEIIPVLPWGTPAAFSSDFGWRNLRGRKDFHGGIDIVAPAGTEVRAVMDGKVVWVNNSGYGGGVIIATAGRTYTYWHSKPRRGLRLGESIRAGEVIATIAPAGTGTHLHYAVHRVTGGRWKLRNDFNAVDPIMLAQEAGLF